MPIGNWASTTALLISIRGLEGSVMRLTFAVERFPITPQVRLIKIEKVKEVTLKATRPTMTPRAKNMKAWISQITPQTERG